MLIVIVWCADPFGPSVLSPASSQSGLLHHDGGQRQEGDHCSLCPHGEEPTGCSYGGSAGQPLCPRQ